MEFLSGQTLEEVVANTGPIPEEEALLIAHEIATALKELDAGGLVHLDIKPLNIMLLDTGDIKLIDFGLVKFVREADPAAAENELICTPHYAAPEIGDHNLIVDIRSDVFSLGATLYFILTGRDAYSGSAADEVFRERFRSKPTPIIDINSEISLEMSEFIQRMMTVEHDIRPGLEQVLEDIKNLISRDT